MALKIGLLVACFAASAYLVVMFCAGLRSPARRRWPPKRLSLVSLIEIWGLSSVVFLAVYLLGALDAGRIGLPGWLGNGIGLPLLILGSALVSLGMAQLGLARTSGGDGGLVTSGVYRWLRHPQYLGHAAALIGWCLYTASLWSLPALGAALLALWAAGRAEEAWLADRYGAAPRDARVKCRLLA